jgi:hypothetical protein
VQSDRLDTQESQPSNILDTSKLKDEINLMNPQESMTISLSPVTKARGLINYDEFKTNGEMEDLVNFKKLVDSKMDDNNNENIVNTERVNINSNIIPDGPKEILKNSDGFKNNKVNTNSNTNSPAPKKKNSYASAIAAIAKAEKNLKTNLTGINSTNNSNKNVNATSSSTSNARPSNESTTTPTSKANITISPPKRNSSMSTSTTNTTNPSTNPSSSLGTTVAKNNLKPKGTIITTTSSTSKPDNLTNLQSPSKPLASSSNEPNTNTLSKSDNLTNLQSPSKPTAPSSNEPNTNTLSNTITNTMASTIKLTSPRAEDPSFPVNLASPMNTSNNLLTSSRTLNPKELRDPEREKITTITSISPSRNNKEEFVIEMNEPKDSITINETDNFIFNTSPQIHMTAENLNKNTQEDWNININNINNSSSNSNSINNSPPRKKNSVEFPPEIEKIIPEVTENDDQEHVEVEQMNLTSDNRQDLSQIDEVLSNISHNLTSRDMYIHRDSIPKIVNLVSASANCFSINPNNKEYLNITAKDRSHLHNYSVNIENSILIPGVHTEIISEPLELNHSVKFSIDPAYSKSRFQFNQSLFDESKMEISIPIIIRKKSPFKRVRETDVEIGGKQVVVSPLEISRMDICLEREKNEKLEKNAKSRNGPKDHRLMRTSKSQENNKATDLYLISTHKRHKQKGKAKEKMDNTSTRGRTEKSTSTATDKQDKKEVYLSPNKLQFKNSKAALSTAMSTAPANKIETNPSFSISEQKKKDFPIASQILSKKVERQENLELTILPVPKVKSKSPEKKIMKDKEIEIKAITIPIVPILTLQPRKEEKIEHQEIEIIGSAGKEPLGIKPVNTPNDQVIDPSNFDKSLTSMLNKIKNNIEKNKEKSIEIFNIANDTVESNRKNLNTGNIERVSPWSTNQNFNPNPSRNNIQEKLEKLSSNKSVKSKSASRSPSKDKFASFNKISKNKIEALRENLDLSKDNESPNSQERKFRQKVDSVKNRLNLVNNNFNYNYQTLFPKTNSDLRVNINTLNSLGNSNYPRRDASPEEDFSDIILPDEIISELQEKYFGKMEFIDRKKLVKFYKKYINKDNNKNNKLSSLDTLDSRKFGSGFLVKQEEKDNQKNIKKLREMLNLKDDTVNSNLRENYFSGHKPNKSNIDVVRSVCDVNQARKKFLVSSSSKECMNFGIMPTNAIDHNSIKIRSNLPNFN